MRHRATEHIIINKQYKQKLLTWSQQFNQVIWLDSNFSQCQYSDYEAIMAVGAESSLRCDYHNAFNKLKEYRKEVDDWIFGCLAYDLKNDIEDLQSINFDGLEFPELYFFQPKKLFLFKNNQLEVLYLSIYKDEIKTDLEAIQQLDFFTNASDIDCNSVNIKLRIHKDDYFKKLGILLNHIYKGDIYEANFCQEFYAENVSIDPLCSFEKLNSLSKAPFAAFVKVGDLYMLSASPERYIKKYGDNIISQPIKGTARRAADPQEDSKLKNDLENDAKERSENIMIVDLVRNDLSKIAKRGSVYVEELCKVYSFEQVHQMISTVTAEVEKQTDPIDIVKASFPMGSMTGAPKISAMEIIENLEETKRGLYSGSVGYISPEGNFDFNVIIRSILYNQAKKYVSYSVGGAITAKSDPVKEYEECLLKAKAMREVLEG